jgi:hypothetical protein
MVVLVATAHYFGARSASPAAAGRQPLFLPRGSVRLIIVAGFVAVGYVLRTRGRLTFDIKDPNAAVFLLVGALVAGAVLRKVLDVLTRGRAIAPRRWFENLKAVAVIVAAAILAFVCFDGSSEAARTAELVAAPLIVFYFGSRN